MLVIEKDVILITEEFVKKSLGQDCTGHDWYHIERVRKNALYICEQEKAGDPFVIEMAALLHDIPDGKLNESEAAGFEILASFLMVYL